MLDKVNSIHSGGLKSCRHRRENVGGKWRNRLTRIVVTSMGELLDEVNTFHGKVNKFLKIHPTVAVCQA